jgi:hypothetical protein
MFHIKVNFNYIFISGIAQFVGPDILECNLVLFMEEEEDKKKRFYNTQLECLINK